MNRHLLRLFTSCLLFFGLVSCALAQTSAKDECQDFSVDDCMVPMTWDALTQWADAWSKKDYNRYIKSYGEDVSPLAGKSRGQWLTARKQALSAPGKIKISLNLIDVQYLSNSSARATVLQRYTAQHYSDIVLKTFHLYLLNRQVKIRTEAVDRNLTPIEAGAIINEFGH